MSLFSSVGAYSFKIMPLHHPDDFRLSWMVDRYYPDSRLRHPRRCTRDTDRKGALRFAKRHGLAEWIEKLKEPEP